MSKYFPFPCTFIDQDSADPHNIVCQSQDIARLFSAQSTLYYLFLTLAYPQIK